MPIRFLLILALLIQSIALPAAAGRDVLVGCALPGCCEVVTTVTCCGDVVQLEQCARSGGPCVCAEQREDPAPATPATPPRDGQTFVQIAATPTTCLAVAAPSRRARWTSDAHFVHRTHNEVQSLLCIWRT